MKRTWITSERFGEFEVTGNDFYGEIKDLNNGLIIYLGISEEIKDEKYYLEISAF